MQNSILKKDRDYYLNENGLMILTASFLSKRGYCCHSGCFHCPYQSTDQVCLDPSYPAELQYPKEGLQVSLEEVETFWEEKDQDAE